MYFIGCGVAGCVTFYDILMSGFSFFVVFSFGIVDIATH